MPKFRNGQWLPDSGDDAAPDETNAGFGVPGAGTARPVAEAFPSLPPGVSSSGIPAAAGGATAPVAPEVPYAPLYTTPPAGTPYVPAPGGVNAQIEQSLAPPPATAAPVVAPGAPSGGGGGGGSAPDGMSAAITESKAAGENATGVANGAIDLAKQKADQDLKNDQLKAQEAEAATGRLSALQARQKSAYDESIASFQKAKEDVANFKLTDFFASRGTATEVIAGIGMLLGGTSYDEHHTNQAISTVVGGIERDSKQQLDFLHSKEHLAELAQQGVRDTQGYLAHEMANFYTAEALKKEAVAAQIDAASGTVRGKQNVNVAQAAAASIRQLAAKDQQAAIIQGTHNRVLQSEIVKNFATAAHERAGVGVAADARKSAEELKVASEIDRRLKADPTTSTLVKSKELLENATANLASGNSAATYGAIDSYLKQASGGVARQQAIAAFKSRLGGTEAQIEGWLSQMHDGKLAPAMTKRFGDALDVGLKYTDTSLSKMAALHEKAMLRSPEYARHPELVRAHIADALHQGGDVAPQAEWKPVPRALAGSPQLKGKTQVLVGADGSIQDAR